MQKILITCEHGGNKIPAEFAGIFAEEQALLQTHRGWDPGALELFRKYEKAVADAVFFSETSRLLIELNRSKNHPNFFSAQTKTLPENIKKQIVEKHYEPYRTEVEKAIRSFLAQKHSVLHLSVHSFTPELNGEIRNADIGLLYDPKRKREKEFCAAWKNLLTEKGWKVRFNYPYRGTADGFTTYLRKQFPDEKYAGIELEVNQKFPQQQTENWQQIQTDLVKTFQALIGK
jgi:predicted N-formylglutamate amidohydrolase